MDGWMVRWLDGWMDGWKMDGSEIKTKDTIERDLNSSAGPSTYWP